MTPASLCGWVAAAWALAGAVLTRRALGRRMEAVARACHEVRGPLTAARLGLSAGALERGLSPSRVRAIESELERATLAVEDLAAARVVSVPRSRVVVSALLADSVAAAQGRAQVAGVDVRGGWDGAEAVVWGERLRLAQGLANLIANAIEHGAGPVRVRGQLRGSIARIEIADCGPGLPASLPQLARGPRAGRGTRGRGLAIASSVARRHGGALATAPSARGAVVVLTLPAFAVASAQRA